jgi:hypothetical protein
MRFSSRLVRIGLPLAVGVVTVGLSAGVASAASSASPVTSIADVLYLTTANPTTAPWFGTVPGSFTAYAADGTVVDAGPSGPPPWPGGPVLVADYILPIPPPVVTQVPNFRSIATAEGTLRMHCSEVARPGVQHETSTFTGSCAVLDATGVYAGLHGSGSLAGVFDEFATPFATLTETIVF